MTTEDDGGKSGGTGSDGMNENWYNAAVQFYNQGLNNISQKTSAFLVVQSILIVALATFLTNADRFPYAIIAILWGITLLGSFFCILHSGSGRSGAKAAFTWRQYMFKLEKSVQEAPWTTFKKSSGGSQLSFLKRAPWPAAWIFIPLAFSIVWVCVSVYIRARAFTPGDQLVAQLPNWLSLDSAKWCSNGILVASGLILLVIVFILIDWLWLWWPRRSND
jgi:hypothetical protein